MSSTAANPVLLELLRLVSAAVQARDPKDLPSGEVRFRCPQGERHRNGDANPSARWNATKGVWRCDVCDTGGGVRNLATMLEIDEPPRPRPSRSKGKNLSPVTSRREWKIRDLAGREVATHIRREHADGTKSYLWSREGKTGLGGLRSDALPLYRTDALGAVEDLSVPVVVVEGEKSADALAGLGVLALGTVTGAASAPSLAVLRCLKGRPVILWPDNDDAGRTHLAKVAERVAAAGAASVHVATWPEAPEKGDAADLVGDGGTADDVQAILDAATPWTSSQELPEIEVTPLVALLVDQAQEALCRRPDLGIYQRGGVLVRVVRDAPPTHKGIENPAGTPTIIPVSIPTLVETLTLAARWTTHTVRDGVEKVRPAFPPREVVLALDARALWTLPRLEGITESPVLLPGDRVLDAPGYDARSGMLYQPSAAYDSIPDKPGEDDLDNAVATVLEPLSEFPFASDSDRAAALAAILTLCARPAIAGPVPMFAINAPAPGSGKGLLADVIAIVASGRTPARTIWPKDRDAQSKVVLALCLEGHAVVLLDNIEGSLGSEVLAAVLTSMDWQDRILGQTRTVRAPHRAVWFTTGNGIVFRGDSHRRVVPINLDAGVEYPEDREFTRGDLLGWVRANRARLCSAAMTILRGYIVAGKPRHGSSRIGSFEKWDDLVRGCVAWALPGIDPCAGRQAVRDQASADLEDLRVLFACWHDAFPQEEAVPIVDVLQRARQADEAGQALLDALVALDPKGNGQPRGGPISYRCRSFRDRVAAGLRMVSAGTNRKNQALWKVIQSTPRGSRGGA